MSLMTRKITFEQKVELEKIENYENGLKLNQALILHTIPWKVVKNMWAQAPILFSKQLDFIRK